MDDPDKESPASLPEIVEVTGKMPHNPEQQKDEVGILIVNLLHPGRDQRISNLMIDIAKLATNEQQVGVTTTMEETIDLLGFLDGGGQIKHIIFMMPRSSHDEPQINSKKLELDKLVVIAQGAKNGEFTDSRNGRPIKMKQGLLITVIAPTTDEVAKEAYRKIITESDVQARGTLISTEDMLKTIGRTAPNTVLEVDTRPMATIPLDLASEADTQPIDTVGD